jgi:hypothetical protein
MSLHDLNTPEGIASAKDRMNAVAKKGGTVEIKEVKDSRTSRQNRYLHKQWQILADDIGDFMEDVKFESKIAIGFYTETPAGYKKPKESSKLSKEEFAELTDKFIKWAFMFHGIRLMTPEEFWRGAE